MCVLHASCGHGRAAKFGYQPGVDSSLLEAPDPWTFFCAQGVGLGVSMGFKPKPYALLLEAWGLARRSLEAEARVGV